MQADVFVFAVTCIVHMYVHMYVRTLRCSSNAQTCVPSGLPIGSVNTYHASTACTCYSSYVRLYAASSTAYAGSGTIFTFDGALDVAMEVPFAADSGVLASMAEYLCTCVCVNRQAMVHAHLYT